MILLETVTVFFMSKFIILRISFFYLKSSISFKPWLKARNFNWHHHKTKVENNIIQGIGAQLSYCIVHFRLLFVVLAQIHQRSCIWPTIPPEKVAPMFYLLL